jgi:hypothetical protein
LEKTGFLLVRNETEILRSKLEKNCGTVSAIPQSSSVVDCRYRTFIGGMKNLPSHLWHQSKKRPNSADSLL